MPTPWKVLITAIVGALVIFVAHDIFSSVPCFDEYTFSATDDIPEYLSPNIAIVTMLRHLGVNGYANNSEPARVAVECFKSSKEEYAARHNYVYFDESMFPDDDNDPSLLPYHYWMLGHNGENKGRYDKIRFMISMMDTHKDVDWFLWLDADAMITNSSVRFEERFKVLLEAADYPVPATLPLQEMSVLDWQLWLKHVNVTFLLGTDINNWNNGVFIMRNCPLARELLNVIYATYVDPDAVEADQNALRQVLQEDGGQLRHIMPTVAVLPQSHFRLLQSYPRLCEANPDLPPPFLWQPGDWILHMPGCPWDTRGEVVIAKDICPIPSSSDIHI